MVYISFLLGFLLLFLGGKYLVEGSVSFAKAMGLSPLIIGIVLIGFGTSMPELVVCIKAALKDSSDLVIGNVIGSNICNILLVLASGAVIYPIMLKNKQNFKIDALILILSSIFLTVFCFLGFVNVYSGILSLVMLFSYLFYKYKTDSIEIEKNNSSVISSVWLSLSTTILGILGVLLGAEFLVNSAIEIERQFGLSEKFIALSAIALGTSLPELATIIIASIKKHSDIALGNVIGSNIFNILGILGITSIIKTVSINPDILRFDIWVANLAILLMVFMTFHKCCLGRKKGAFLLLLYVVYISIIYLRG